MKIEEAARLLRTKNLAFSLSYKRIRRGLGKGGGTYGWKWTAGSHHESGAKCHFQGSSPEKAIMKLLKREGLI